MSDPKHQPKKIKAVAGGNIKWIVTIKQWIHQGFTYLDHTERFYRVVWELVPAALFLWLFKDIANMSWTWSVVLAFVISHTINWIFNYNFWTCIDFTFPSVKNPGNDATIQYLAEVQERMNKSDIVIGCLLYGSMSRHVWHDKSDLDMRIIGKPGLLNGFKIYLLVCRERLIAVKKKQPLDLYMADSVDFLNKMRDDEFPIVLKANDERLTKRYGELVATDFRKAKDLNHLS
ncbi:MAG: hypothetical protein LUD00_04540 [Prevotellaceae bacterium]|nr:hypothetical protein [Prevotellaceae bacterium]